MRNDHNCLFRAFAKVIFNDQDRWKEARNLIADYRQSSDEMKDQILKESSTQTSLSESNISSAEICSQYIGSIRNTIFCNWGGYIEALAFQRMYPI